MQHPTEVKFPGGESFVAMQARVLKATQELTTIHEGESIAIVTQGGVNRIILADALGMPATHMFRIGQGYAARNLIRYIADYPAVEIVNQTPEVLCSENSKAPRRECLNCAEKKGLAQIAELLRKWQKSPYNRLTRKLVNDSIAYRCWQ